jgi:hypothetical protein
MRTPRVSLGRFGETPTCLTDFWSFEGFLVGFGSFAARHQGRDDPDMSDLRMRAAFELKCWNTVTVGESSGRQSADGDR